MCIRDRLTNSVLLIPLVGGIYFAEAISVILQVASFKLTGKRIFKMAPIHHHFEQCGWPETKVVFTFWIVTIVPVSYTHLDVYKRQLLITQELKIHSL